MCVPKACVCHLSSPVRSHPFWNRAFLRGVGLGGRQGARREPLPPAVASLMLQLHSPDLAGARSGPSRNRGPVTWEIKAKGQVALGVEFPLKRMENLELCVGALSGCG